MSRLSFSALALLGLTALPLLAFASSSPATEVSKPWSGTIDLGLNSSMGTSTGSKNSFHGKVNASYAGSYWTQTLTGEGLGVHDETPGSRNSERYLASYKARHYFKEHDFFTWRQQWEKDLLSKYEYQAFVSLGLGMEVFKTDTHFLKIEAGPGLRHSEGRQAPDHNNSMGLYSWDYDWKIRPDTELSQKGSYETGQEGRIFRVNTLLRENISRVLSLRLSHDYKQESGNSHTRAGVVSFGMGYQF